MSGHGSEHDPEHGHEHVHDHVDSREHAHGDGHEHVHGHGGHRHVHSEEERKAVTNRLARAIGHLEAVKRMVERGEDCNDVLIQLAAVKSEIQNTGKLVLKNHLRECAVEAAARRDFEYLDEMNAAIDKFMK